MKKNKILEIVILIILILIVTFLIFIAKKELMNRKLEEQVAKTSYTSYFEKNYS